MSAFWAFTKKEFTESLRTYKLLILGVVFLLLGMMNPIFAKFMPDILASVASELNIALSEPTAMDSWAQFFSNVGQIGLLTLVMVYSGLMAGELHQGTLVNMLTKGLRRGTVIVSKFAAATCVWTLCYLLCLGITAVYTAYFWQAGQLHNVFLTFVCLWLYGELLIALCLMGGVLFGRTLGALLFTGGAVVAMTLAGIFPQTQKYNPAALSGDATALLQALRAPSDVVPAAIICAMLILVLVAGSIAAFDKKQI